MTGNHAGGLAYPAPGARRALRRIVTFERIAGRPGHADLLALLRSVDGISGVGVRNEQLDRTTVSYECADAPRVLARLDARLDAAGLRRIV